MLISDEIFSLFQKSDTVASKLAESPTSTINSLCKKHFDSNGHGGTHNHKLVVGDTPLTKEDLDRAEKCGKFGKRPSDLFLSMYAEVLRTLRHDQLVNLVAPPIMASTGVIPLSIISVIPDIMRHYADVIVTAETEVFLATNYWEASTAQKIITDALIELSKRAGARGKKVVFKMMYDRGNIKQLLEPHQIVKEEIYTSDAVKLPKPSEIPNVDLEVCNYHHPVLGTFHAKYMVVDRKIAIINSNNVQDRVNVEMMTHIEGPIVEAFYDMCLVSWGAALTPQLPLLTSPPNPNNMAQSYKFQNEHDHIKTKDMESAKEDATKTLLTSQYPSDMDAGRKEPVSGPETTKMGDASQYDTDFAAEKKNDEVGMHGKDQSLNDKLAAITKRLNTTIQPDTKATLQTLAADGVDFTDFNPHIIHAPHAPFPIAMVNRKPRGSMNYTDIDNPQNVAWLAGFHYAKKSVFIQTPTFTAPPVIDAALAAARRGIEVTIFADIGFNDSGEALPYQGGTNEVNAIKMFKELEPEFKKNLRYFWYTGKDMIKPINANLKKRNCHVKIMIVDDYVGIQGNGNQDGQSWFHSQEANIMIDSMEVCQEWMTGIRSNQNTQIYGRLDDDGIWRDPKDGSELEDMGGRKSGPSAIISGLAGTLRRVQGKGGFGT